ncbi:MAG: hypothetical protein FD135_2717 [Comamonadaceae bacterium]|nr:MAG: hypothetical protein FD135_2717 [Comamonadaceae bacterium]
MNSPDKDEIQEVFLKQLLSVVERIASSGEFQAVGSLIDLTVENPQHPLLTSLAEGFARMAVQLEAREFELENTIENLVRVKQELELANYDPLTQLANRVIARDRLSQGLLQARRLNQFLGVLYLDLDRFKWVNDNLGHAAGDELLRQVALRMRGVAREADTVARLGGDEFLCVIPAIGNPSAAEDLATRLVDILSQPFSLAAGQVTIGASVGIAVFPAHADTVDALIACADSALYDAKHAGRNGFRVYKPQDQA